MTTLKYLVALIVALAALLLTAGQLGFLSGTMPATLGVIQGRLSPPSTTANSVSSQAGLYPDHPQKEYASIAPLRFTGDGDVAMEKLAGVLRESARTVVIHQIPGYIYAQATTQWLKFTDDVEFWFDRENQVIQVRSASRLGQKDLGINRARIEAIRARFNF